MTRRNVKNYYKINEAKQKVPGGSGEQKRNMKQEQVIQRITELGKSILPEGASLWLYGSRARGDNRPDSDYDLLILLDKEKLTSRDYDCVFDLRMLGIELNEEINPTVYPKKRWNEWSFTPFYYNVEEDKVVLA